MKTVRSAHYIASLLIILMAVAPAVFAIPAAAMTLQTGFSAEGAPGNCDCCPGSDRDKGFCAQLCLNAAIFATVLEPAGISVIDRQGQSLMHIPVHTGLGTIPDPDPPKPVSPIWNPWPE